MKQKHISLLHLIIAMGTLAVAITGISMVIMPLNISGGGEGDNE